MAPAFGKKNRMPIYYYYDEEDDIAVPNIAKTGVSAVKVFWILSLAAALLGAVLGASFGEPREGLVIGLVLLALAFPAVQLGIVIVLLIWLAISSRPDRSFQFWQVGKITLGLFVGTAAGIMTMVAIGVMMR